MEKKQRFEMYEWNSQGATNPIHELWTLSDKLFDGGGNLGLRTVIDHPLLSGPRFHTTVFFKDWSGYYLFENEFDKLQHAFQISAKAHWNEYLKYSWAHDRKNPEVAS